MSVDYTSAFLVLEFMKMFPKRALQMAANFPEIKITQCSTTGLPVFTYGRYHGSSNAFGFFNLADDAIHLHLHKEMLHAMLYHEGEETVELQIIQAKLLKDLYRQMLLQSHRIEKHFYGVPLRHAMNKSEELPALYAKLSHSVEVPCVH